MNQINIGRFISRLRKENSLTQRDLALKLGITNQAVSKWERGENMPDISTLMELSKIFNVTVDELLKGERVNDFVDRYEDNNVNKSDLHDNFSKNTKDNTGFHNSRRRKVLMALAIGLYACSPISFFLFEKKDHLSLITFFTILGGATFLMVFSYNSSSSHNDKIDESLKPLSSIIYTGALIIFFFFGTYYKSWNPIIFILAGLVVHIIDYIKKKSL